MKTMLWNDAQKFIAESKKPIYLWFGTNWCGDCQMMLPIVEAVEEKLANKDIDFIKVDAEEANLFRVDSKHKVLKVPTHVFMKNSQIKSIMYEYIPEETIIEEIEKLMYEE